MPRNDILSYDELIRELRRLCQEARTGTLFIATSENHAVRIVIQRGEITHVLARGQAGMAAVASLKQITGGRLTYSENATDGGPTQSLPKTAELLAMLGGGERTRSGGAATGSLLATLQQVRPIIEQELTEYIGPLAVMLYEELIARIGHGGGPTTLDETIDSLASEIRDPAKSSRFKEGLRARLAATPIEPAP